MTINRIIRAITFAAALFWNAPSVAQPCSGIIQSGYFCGNSGASSAPGAAISSPTALFDRAFGSTANSILARGASSYSMTQTLPSAVQDNITRLGTIANIGAPLGGAFGGTGVVNTGKTITLGGNLTTSGAFNSTFTMTGTTSVTFPTSGTLATTATANVASVSNSDGTLTISPTTGAVVASLNLAHANSWTALQTMTVAGASALDVRSGASGSFALLTLGRTASELNLELVALANQVTTGTATGDATLNAINNLWLLTNAANTASTGGNVYLGRGSLGSVWPNVSPNNSATTRARDRLFVDDGALSTGLLGTAGVSTSLPNTRGGTAINLASGGWTDAPWLSSLYVLSSTGNAAIFGQTTTSLHTLAGANSSIGLGGMTIIDHPSQAYPGYGIYGEVLKLTTGKGYAAEFDIGNTRPPTVLSIYGANTEVSIAVHAASGGSIGVSSSYTYTTASAAYDIEGYRALFDRGIVFRSASLLDQGGGVYNAINFPTSYRINWFRNNSGADQLQAYITATNTTTGTVVGHDLQSIEFQAAGVTTLSAESLVVYSESTNNADIRIGRGATGNRQSSLLFYTDNTGTLTAGIVRSSGANGKLLLAQAGNGSIDITALGGAQLFSGASGTLSAFGVGRTASELILGVAASASQFASGTAAGDGAVQALANLFLVANGSGTSVAIKLATTGITTFPGSIVVPGSSSGTLTIRPAAAAGSNTLTFPAGTTDFSATGGTSQVVKQTSAGGAFTVARLACADLSDAGTGCSAGSGITALTGDGTATGPGSVAFTLATVNSNVGTFGSATQSVQFTVNGKGLVTAAANVTVTPAVGSITGLGTGVATALAINVGSAGAFVTFNGALGSPSSAGTIPAFTLGGTIAGGGNQINNVIIGTTTPLAGFFTTLSGSTSVTSPLIIGGTATSATLTLESTSGVGATDSIVFKTGSQITRGTIATDGTWAIGANAPTTSYLLDVNSNSTNTASGISATPGMRIVSSNAASSELEMNAFGPTGNSNRIAGTMAAGTMASPTALTAASNMFLLAAYGYDGTAYRLSGAIIISSTETFSGSARGTNQTFYVNPNGSTTLTLAMTIQPDTGVSFGTSTSPGAGGLQINGQIFAPNMASDTATVDSTVCTATTGGKFLKGTGALGICLGTSGRQFKTDFAPMTAGLNDLMKVNFQTYHYRPGFGDDGVRLQYGTTAQDVEAALPDLVRRDASGVAINYDSGALLFIGLRSIQQLKAANDNLSARVSELENTARRANQVK